MQFKSKDNKFLIKALAAVNIGHKKTLPIFAMERVLIVLLLLYCPNFNRCLVQSKNDEFKITRD